jgi:hypothetical protein
MRVPAGAGVGVIAGWPVTALAEEFEFVLVSGDDPVVTVAAGGEPAPVYPVVDGGGVHARTEARWGTVHS